MPLFVNKGRDVFPDPTGSSDGGLVLHSAMIVPPEEGEHINGAPVEDLSHQIVIKNKNAPDR